VQFRGTKEKIIMPMKDISAYKGIAKGSSFTANTLRTTREDERIKEDGK